MIPSCRAFALRLTNCMAAGLSASSCLARGRVAYLGGFHAAQALTWERTGQIAKTHEGVNSQFTLLTKGDKRIDTELRRFLPQAYNLKAVADYEAGPGSIIPLERVEAAIAI